MLPQRSIGVDVPARQLDPLFRRAAAQQIAAEPSPALGIGRAWPGFDDVAVEHANDDRFLAVAAGDKESFIISGQLGPGREARSTPQDFAADRIDANQFLHLLIDNTEWRDRPGLTDRLLVVRAVDGPVTSAPPFPAHRLAAERTEGGATGEQGRCDASAPQQASSVIALRRTKRSEHEEIESGRRHHQMTPEPGLLRQRTDNTEEGPDLLSRQTVAPRSHDPYLTSSDVVCHRRSLGHISCSLGHGEAVTLQRAPHARRSLLLLIDLQLTAGPVGGHDVLRDLFEPCSGDISARTVAINRNLTEFSRQTFHQRRDFAIVSRRVQDLSLELERGGDHLIGCRATRIDQVGYPKFSGQQVAFALDDRARQCEPHRPCFFECAEEPAGTFHRRGVSAAGLLFEGTLQVGQDLFSEVGRRVANDLLHSRGNPAIELDRVSGGDLRQVVRRPQPAIDRIGRRQLNQLTYRFPCGIPALLLDRPVDQEL